MLEKTSSLGTYWKATATSRKSSCSCPETPSCQLILNGGEAGLVLFPTDLPLEGCFAWPEAFPLGMLPAGTSPCDSQKRLLSYGQLGSMSLTNISNPPPNFRPFLRLLPLPLKFYPLKKNWSGSIKSSKREKLVAPLTNLSRGILYFSMHKDPLEALREVRVVDASMPCLSTPDQSGCCIPP